MSIEEYTEIKNPGELEVFLHQTVTFHDSMLKELQMINRAFVMESKSMDMWHRFDVKILFQTQWDPIAFELVCLDVSYLSTTEPDVFEGSSGNFIESPEQLIKLSLDGEFVVHCKRLYYKLSPELYGNNEHLGSQVPCNEMVKAEILEDEWRQCGNCSDAWEVSVSRKIATCPSCNKVTYLNGT